MKSIGRLLFSLFCIVMILFSTVTPSLVLAVDNVPASSITLENEIETNLEGEQEELSANESQTIPETIVGDIQAETGTSEEVHIIKIHAGEDRTNIHGEGRIINSRNSNFIYTDYVAGDAFIVIQQKDIEQQEVYKLFLFINYTEGEKQYQFIDEIILTGEQLLDTTELTIPSDNALKKTNFLYDGIDFENMGIMLHFGNDSDNWGVVRFNLHGETITSRSEIHGKLSFQGKSDRTNYLLSAPFTIGHDVIIQNLLYDTSSIDIINSAESLQLYNEKGYGDFYLHKIHDETVVITKGSYYMKFSNEFNWNGKLDFFQNKKIELPTQPEALTITKFNQELDNSTNEISIRYSLGLESGPFSVTNENINTELEISNGTDTLFQWEDKSLYGLKVIPSTKIKKGNYQFNVSLQLMSKTWTTSKQIDVNSPFQSLKGTVITAENKTGDELKSGIVSIYKIDSSSGGLIVRVPIKQEDEKFEAFIPDTYLLSGNEYLVVVESEEEKVIHAKKIVGQEEKYITFTSDALKEIEFESKNIQTVKTHFYFMEPNGDTFIPREINGGGWSISGEYDLEATWLGQLGDIGYEWTGKIGNQERTVDLTKVVWQTIKPSPQYQNAKVKANHFEDSFDELKVNGMDYGWKFAELIVNDNGLIYVGEFSVPLHLGVGELSFGHFSGNAYQHGELVYTYFYNNSGSLRNITAENADGLSLEYEIYDEQNRLVGNRIKTNNIHSFKLPNPLPVGIYTIKLVGSNVNPNILTLSMETEFVVKEYQGESESVPLIIPVETDTVYGKVNSNWYMRIDRKNSVGNYNYFAWLNWDEKTKSFIAHDPIEINANDEYILTAQYEVENSGSKIIDEQRLSGNELISFSNESPLKITADLKLLTVENNLEGPIVEFVLENSASNRKYEVYQYPHYNVYVPSGMYSLTIGRGNGSPAGNIVFIPRLNVNQDKKMTLKEEGLSEISFYSGREKLNIIRNLPQRYYYNPNESITSVFYEKGKYENQHFYVAVENEFQTPWAYHLDIPTIDLTKDQTLQFSGDINGKINSALLRSDEYGDLWLSVDYTLLSEDLIVDSIYRTLEPNRHDIQPFAMLLNDPIRDYNGQFNQWHKVEPTYSLKDQSGKLVWKMSREYWGDANKGIPLYQKLPSGEYTLELLIPTGPQQSITLTEKVVVDKEEYSSIDILSPAEGQVIHENRVTVKGKAKAGMSLIVELHKDDKIVDIISITADTKGNFTHTFNGLADGSYYAFASNSRYGHGVPFTIDTSASGKVTGIQFSNEAEGLKVSWSAASNAVSYTVEVAEGDGPFELLASNGRTAFIPNRKASVTYHVRITAHSGSGKVNVSEIVSYKVPSEGNTGGNGGTGGTDNNVGEGSKPVNPKPVEPKETNPDSEKDSVEKLVLNQIMDSSKNEISIEFSTDENNTDKLTATFDSTIWKQVLESKKPLIIKADGVSMRIPTETIKGIATRDGDQVIVKIAYTEEKNIPKISSNQRLLSSLYDFSIIVKNGDLEREITSFATPISITVEIGPVKNAKKVAAFYLNEKEGVWEYVGGALLNDSFTFYPRHFSKYAVIENDKTFSDIHEVAWAAEYIEVLASKNIIQGKTEDLFAPSVEITRAQFAALLSRAMNLPKESYVGIFHDVSELNWAALDIEAANRAGIVGGENGLFKPGEKITRQQMATMIIRAVEYKNPKLLEGVENTLPFKDASSISDYAKKYVGLSVALGIISGREEKGEFYFAPKENATRAHAAKMLYQFMELN